MGAKIVRIFLILLAIFIMAYYLPSFYQKSVEKRPYKTMIYFTADTHFGHANIVKMCEWPYPDIESMNEAMIEA